MSDIRVPTWRSVRKAIKEGDLPEVVRLIAGDPATLRTDTPFGTLLHMASTHGKVDIVRWLVSQGLNVNIRAATIEGRPLEEASANGHVEVVRYLIESGASLDVEDSVRNPLFAAIVGGASESHTEVAKVLINSGIDTSVRYPNLRNMDAMEFAAEWGRDDIVALLRQQA